MGHGKHESGIHAELLTEDVLTDLTEEGIGIYEPINPWECDEAKTIHVFLYPYGALAWDKAATLQIAGVKMDRRDLWRCALEMQPVGLVCTTYVQALIGLSVKGYKPLEVLEYIKQECGGYTWTRDTENNWMMT